MVYVLQCLVLCIFAGNIGGLLSSVLRSKQLNWARSPTCDVGLLLCQPVLPLLIISMFHTLQAQLYLLGGKGRRQLCKYRGVVQNISQIPRVTNSGVWNRAPRGEHRTVCYNFYHYTYFLNTFCVFHFFRAWTSIWKCFTPRIVFIRLSPTSNATSWKMPHLKSTGKVTLPVRALVLDFVYTSCFLLFFHTHSIATVFLLPFHILHRQSLGTLRYVTLVLFFSIVP